MQSKLSKLQKEILIQLYQHIIFDKLNWITDKYRTGREKTSRHDLIKRLSKNKDTELKRTDQQNDELTGHRMIRLENKRIIKECHANTQTNNQWDKVKIKNSFSSSVSRSIKSLIKRKLVELHDKTPFHWDITEISLTNEGLKTAREMALKEGIIKKKDLDIYIKRENILAPYIN